MVDFVEENRDEHGVEPICAMLPIAPATYYGLAGSREADGDAEFDLTCSYEADPTKPLETLKVAWEGAKKRADVSVRWHDLRHTFCTRLLESGIAFPLLSSLMGWSPATTARMAKRYGHVGVEALRDAVAKLNGHEIEAGWAQNRAQSAETESTLVS